MEQNWTVKKILTWTKEWFEGKGVLEPRLSAEHLLAHTLNLKRMELYVQFDRPLSEEELTSYRVSIKRRATGEPVQYLLGSQPFYGLDLKVTPDVLIPRPETEQLVAFVITELGENGREKPYRIFEIGSGSGAIAIALAHTLPNARVISVDISQAALDIARENAATHGVLERIDFRLGSIYDPLSPNEKDFDLIVSNPPYIGENEQDALPREVSEHEPRQALFAGPDGLDVIRPLIEGAPELLVPGGLVAMEIGYQSAQPVTKMFEAASNNWGSVKVVRDYRGVQRVVIARSPVDE